MTADPYQLDNLHGRPEHAELEAWLSDELTRLRSQS